MRYLCLLLCVFALFSSCKESEKDKIARLVEEWEGKEILFPAHSFFTIQGKDTVDFSLADADYKVVTYIDSVGCTSCKLQLLRWKLFMQEVDSTLNRPVPFVFYFHPKDMKELRYITRRDAFVYPVCFDEKDDFNRLNHFPDEMTFQTFLLDKDNRVAAIGNPVHNPKVKELYLKVLTGCKSGNTDNESQSGRNKHRLRFISSVGEAGTQVHTDQYGTACTGDIRCHHFLWMYQGKL